MSLSIGIVGLPNVGKSTLFKALTKKQVDIQNYPFCTIEPNVGVVAVPDERLAKLAAFSHTTKIIPTIIEFSDIAGLVRGASQGEGLGNQFLSHIRETKAIAQVVRIFEDENIIHVEKRIDPLGDVEVINLELIFADLSTVTKRLEKTTRDAKSGNKELAIEKELLEKIKTALESGALVNTLSFEPGDLPFVKELNLLTAKPILYVLNKKLGGKNLDELNDERYQRLMEYFKKNAAVFVVLDASIELELNELSQEDREEYKKELGIADASGLDALIQKSYELLGLETYITTGEMETRAWTIRKGTKAPQAAAEIHGDFEKKFIRAEVINWQDLLNAGSFAAAREKGLLRTEGKEYVVKDGDVIEFKI
ncbi:MAG: redox-regulated ATPase YchF [Candidatus Azambacteria bacterium]|nr:redox-regulated ATPase YchF [Candidatus Azambacteria bacterium]